MAKNMQLKIKTLKEINAVAQKFVSQMGDNTVFAFYGKMGAGKTTFIKAICEVLGITDTVNSPTFSIINEYLLPDGNLAYHFDFYRINNISEAVNIGTEEYFYSGNLCFIEWAEKIPEILPENTVKVQIEVLENDERTISF